MAVMMAECLDGGAPDVAESVAHGRPDATGSARPAEPLAAGAKWNIAEDKRKLRAAMRQTRHAVAAEEALAAGRSIAARLDAIARFVAKPGAIAACYLSIAGEVDSAPLIEWCRAKGMSVAVPASNGANGYAWAELKPGCGMADGPMGIPEPAGTRIVQPQELALALVPGVAFDRHGYRLGHGRGHMDRLYADARDCLKVGIAFDWQVLDEIPFETHDVRMDTIATASATYDKNTLARQDAVVIP